MLTSGGQLSRDHRSWVHRMISELCKVYEWFKCNKLSLNVMKTKVMVVEFQQRPENLDRDLEYIFIYG